MFRKSGRKTRSAIRGGGSGVGRRIVPAGGGGTDSSDSTATAPALVVMNKNCPTGAIGIGIGSARSPFITPRAGNGTNADLEQARSFYFSPLNSWNDHGAQGNDDFPQQQHAHNIHIATDALITDDVERTLRQIVICCTIFIAGTMLSEHAPVAYHILELALVAWGTSLFIIIMEKRRMVRTATTTTSPAKRTIVAEISSSLGTHKIIEAMEKPTTSFASDELQGSYGEELTTIRRKRSRHEIISEPDSDERPSPEALPELTMELAVSTASKRQNPHLEHLYVMMVGKMERIVPNCTTYDIDTDLFSGKMLLMFRTPDVDEPTKTNDPMVNYFRGKQRRFEFQWQLRLKKLPPGDLFLGVEVDEPIQMGMIQRALANTALKFTKKMNQVSISRKDRTCSVSPWFLRKSSHFLHSSLCTSCQIHVGILLLFFGFIG